MDLDDDSYVDSYFYNSHQHSSSILGAVFEGLRNAQLRFYNQALSLASVVDTIVLNSIEAVKGSGPSFDFEAARLKPQAHSAAFSGMPFVGVICSGNGCKAVLVSLVTFVFTLGIFSVATYVYLKQRNRAAQMFLMKVQNGRQPVQDSHPSQTKAASDTCTEKHPEVQDAEEVSLIATDAKPLPNQGQRSAIRLGIEGDTGEKNSEKLSRNVSFCHELENAKPAMNKGVAPKVAKKTGKQLKTKMKLFTEKIPATKRRIYATKSTPSVTQPFKVISAPSKPTPCNRSKLGAARSKTQMFSRLSPSPKTRFRGGGFSRTSVPDLDSHVSSNVSSRSQSAPRCRPHVRQPARVSRDLSVSQKAFSSTTLPGSFRIDMLAKSLKAQQKSLAPDKSTTKRSPVKPSQQTIKLKESKSKICMQRRRDHKVKKSPGSASLERKQSLTSHVQRKKLARKPNLDRISNANVGKIRRPFRLNTKNVVSSSKSSNNTLIKSRDLGETMISQTKKGKHGECRLQQQTETKKSNNQYYPTSQKAGASNISALFSSRKTNGEDYLLPNCLVRPVATREKTGNEGKNFPGNFRIRKTETPELKSLTGEGAFTSYSKTEHFDLNGSFCPATGEFYKSVNKEAVRTNTFHKLTMAEEDCKGKLGVIGVTSEMHCETPKHAQANHMTASGQDKPQQLATEMADINVNSWLGFWPEQGRGDKSTRDFLTESTGGKHTCFPNQETSNRCSKCNLFLKTKDNWSLSPTILTHKSDMRVTRKELKRQYGNIKDGPGHISLQPWPARKMTHQCRHPVYPSRSKEGQDQQPTPANIFSHVCEAQLSTREFESHLDNGQSNTDTLFDRHSNSVKHTDTTASSGDTEKDTHRAVYHTLCFGSDGYPRVVPRETRSHEQKCCFTYDNKIRDYPYIIKGTTTKHKSRKENLNFSLRSCPNSHKAKSHPNSLSRHRVKMCRSGCRQSIRGTRKRGLELSEDDVLNVLESDLARPRRLLKAKRVKEEKERESQGQQPKPHPLGHSISLQYMLHELHDLAHTKHATPRSSKDFYGYFRRCEKPETWPWYPTSNESFTTAKRYQDKPETGSRAHRYHHRCHRLRSHRHEPYKMDTASSSSSSAYAHSQRKLNKNNCSPCKEKRFVVLPHMGRAPASEPDFSLEIDMNENPGYDCRHVVASGVSEVGSEMYHDPYGDSSAGSRPARLADRERITKLLWPHGKNCQPDSGQQGEEVKVKEQERCHFRLPYDWRSVSHIRARRGSRQNNDSLRSNHRFKGNALCLARKATFSPETTEHRRNQQKRYIKNRLPKGNNKIWDIRDQKETGFNHIQRYKIHSIQTDSIRNVPTDVDKNPSTSARSTKTENISQNVEASSKSKSSISKHVGVQTSPTLNSTKIEIKAAKNMKTRSLLPKLICNKLHRPMKPRPFLRRQRSSIPRRVSVVRLEEKEVISDSRKESMLSLPRSPEHSGKALNSGAIDFMKPAYDKYTTEFETSKKNTDNESEELTFVNKPVMTGKVIGTKTEMDINGSLQMPPENLKTSEVVMNSADHTRKSFPESIQRSKEQSNADNDVKDCSNHMLPHPGKDKETVLANKSHQKNVKIPKDVQEGTGLCSLVEEEDSTLLNRTYSIRNTSPTTYSRPNATPKKISESNTFHPLSGLQNICLIRPMWQNADVTELDRRVRRALRLREELQQCKMNKQNTSTAQIITQISECKNSDTSESPATEDLRPSDTDEIPSCQLDATSSFHQFSSSNIARRENCSLSPTNASTLQNEVIGFEKTQPQREIIENVTDSVEQGGHYSIDGNFTSGIESFNNTDVVAQFIGNKSMEHQKAHDFFVQEQAGDDKAEMSGEGAVNDDFPVDGLDELSRRVGRSGSFHYILHQPVTQRPERPSSAHISSKPSNSGHCGLKRLGHKQKNSPPTKISKVDNAATPGGSRLVGQLVKSLPHVPLLSFVEWFIETSDPRNFIDSGKSSSSSNPGNDRDRTTSPKAGITRSQDTSPTKVPFQRPREKDKNLEELLSVSYKTAPNLHSKHIATPFLKPQPTGLNSFESFRYEKNRDIDSSHLSVTPTTPTNVKIIGEPTDRKCNKDALRIGQYTPEKQPPKSKARKIRHIMNPNVDDIIRPIRSHRQRRYTVTKSLFPPSSLQGSETPSYETVPKMSLEPAAKCQMNKENGEVSNGFDSKKAICTGNSEEPRVAHTPLPNEASSNQNWAPKSSPLANGTAQHPDGIAKILTSFEPTEHMTESLNAVQLTEQNIVGTFSSPGKSLEDRPAVPAMQLFLGSQLYQPTESAECKETADKCAPGIRQILMKLRNVKDTGDSATVAQPDRMRITLRKSSDVTGIIAKFQGTGGRK
ncbi:uncharacterized protein LOC101861385 [Aplysia californica]|uniref:Uncharacterized protein LOC101861385 n=1 Tax=Aplysia californica TaxID=6500 RepID=A0ABM0K0M2_APLCA|nr:uncharacterized protein LOC101861385 [Aplysia californica]